MTNSLSVLLIIGSVVVGPIEAQPKSIPQTVDHCISRVRARGVANEADLIVLCRRDPNSVFGLWNRDGLEGNSFESLPELCERAMREAGAFEVYRYGPSKNYPNGLITYRTTRSLAPGIDGSNPEQWWALTPKPLDAYKTFEMIDYWNEKYRVRCIPTPAGYRK